MRMCHGATMDLKICKRDTIKTAKQLLYSPEVINKIRKAQSTTEVYRIMITARKEEIKDE